MKQGTQKNKRNHNKKEQTIATQVVASVATTIILVNILLVGGIWYGFDKNLRASETKYMSEVISRISLEATSELDKYVTVVEGLAQNYVLTEYLLFEENYDPMTPEHEIVDYVDLVTELSIVAKMHEDSVLYVSLCSIYGNNYITNRGEQSGSAFSISSLPYYEVVSSKSTYISNPYDDDLTDFQLVAIASPVFDSSGRMIGIASLEISLEQLSKLLSSTSFGETGTTFMLDSNNNILLHEETERVGKSLSSSGYEGDSFYKEIENPTGNIIEYKNNTVPRLGGVALVNELTGWKLVSAMDTDEFQSTIHRILGYLVLAQTLALLCTMFFCAKSIFRNLAPMKDLEGFMEQLSKGNLSDTVDYPIPNEIGRLAKHMNDTAQNLSSYISQIAFTMKEFENGNFTTPKPFSYEGEFQEIGNSMNQFVDMMSNILQDLKQSLHETNLGTSHLATGAQQLAVGSSEQAESVRGMNALIENINVTIVETAENSSTVTTDAEKISMELKQNNEKMRELVISVQDIKQMSDEVKRIIQTIEDVAFQTNILSLNASIEASRAGTSGRGFAVVAEQVRSLSARTAEAAEETSKIITEIALAIELNSHLAQNTSQELQGVVNDVNIFVEKITHISLSAQGQADAISEINKGVTEISDVVSRNSSISEESAAATEELSAQSTVMMSQIARFKLATATTG